MSSLISDALLDVLQAIRDGLGRPVMIYSGYRPDECETSQHHKGRAADIKVPGMHPRDVARWIEANLFPSGLGLYDHAVQEDGFVHVDYRIEDDIPLKPFSRWVQTSRDDSTYRSLSGKTITAAYLDKAED